MTVMATGGAASRTTAAEKRSLAAPSASSLWQLDSLLRWSVTTGLGAIVIAGAWYIAAGEATFSQQVGPIDAALAGLLVAGTGNLTWLLRGRRALGERRRQLLRDVAPAAPAFVAGPEHEMLHPHTVEAGAATTLVAGEGMERYHRPDCPMAMGRAGWTAMTRAAHEGAGRRPCGVCRP